MWTGFPNSMRFIAIIFLATAWRRPPSNRPTMMSKVRDERDGAMDPPDAEELNEAGGEATAAESLALRQFSAGQAAAALRRLNREAPRKLPRRRSRRFQRSSRGRAYDMRRSLREAVKRDGEILVLPRLDRRMRQRRILLLIDISGSMKSGTDSVMRFAHGLVRAADRVEVFTVGTRLTRVSRALRHRNPDVALETASTIVADWDGGTRLGDALQAFLAVPRFKGFARGAVVLVISDGLERGDPGAMVDAVEQLSRLSWSLTWLSPLAADADFIPETVALKAALPYIDRLADAGSLERITEHVLNSGTQAYPS